MNNELEYRAAVQAETHRTVKTNRFRNTAFLIGFIGPALLVYLLYVIVPIFATLYYSLFNWNGIQSEKAFIGFGNYAKLLADTVFMKTIGNNLLLVVASIVTQLPLGLAMALILTAPIRGIRLYRTIYFMPLLMSTVALGILWTFIYDPTMGIVNQTLDVLGLQSWQKGWLGDAKTAFWAVTATICWQFAPFYMILFRAAMVGIPEEIYESAKIDGCSGSKQFWHITLPLLKPTIVTSSVLSVIGSLKYFDLIFVMTEGGPASSTELMATYMYKQAFSKFSMGYASSISFTMFVIAFIVAVIILAADKNRGKTAA
ncbi:carbohydrate ABC transporter permease [Paenibacillus thalictri]|uniref:Sugar ABC transporter permease n=1 Tax=Paenibacillus thalictri TaxID=2527873 RepID=A0A4Q9DPP5_9BACL|nr:sugar ABC transporter permease [Paenibacillus thalictri]TBL76618.1 sugar ABC transporter permease [Paenibacillus thalictri]